MSNEPISIGRDAWFYVEKTYAHVFVQARDKGGNYLTTAEVRVPWRKLEAALSHVRRAKTPKRKVKK